MPHPPSLVPRARRRCAGLLTALITATTALVGVGTATVAAAPPAAAAANGVGSTPAMGWSSWSYIRHDPTAANIEAQARAMVSSGLASAGYLYVNVDDFWYNCPGSQGPNVDSYGRWVTNSTSFPPSSSGENGIAVVADYVHSLGLKFGLYVTPGISDQAVSANTPIQGTSYTASQIANGSSEANYNCGGMQGINYSAAGAQAFINSWADEFASWGVDYLKLDGVGDSDIGDVQAWSTGLQQSGRPIHLELSNSLDIANASTWAQYSNGWRTGGDIECYCGSDSSGNPQPLTTWGSIQGRFAQIAQWQPYGGPGAFNDYDSIEFGDGSTIDGLSTTEGQSQYGLWAMAASPLLLGVDLTQLNSTEVADLKNPGIVAVDQDGIDARRIVSNVNQQAYAKTEQNGDVILGLFNFNGSGSQTVTVSLAAAGITGSATATNLWTGASAGTLSGTYSVTLAAGASQILKLVPVSGTQGSTTYQAASSANTLAGGAVTASCNSCLGGQKVGYVGDGGTLTFNNVNVGTAGNYEVQVDYLDGTSSTTGRSSTITVDGTSEGSVTYTPTGSFANPGSTTVSLPLKAGSNTIEFSNSSAYAPDFAAITVPTSPTTSSTTYLAASASLGGSAGVASCSACTGGEKVGYVGNNSGTITYSVSATSAGVYPVQIVYCDGTSGTTGRSATFTVNGTVVQTNVFTPTGGFSTPGTVTDYFPLKAGTNTIEISNGSAYAPDFNSIIVNQ
jgi:Alpha galactosidase A/Alpha galactosidase C-terminal beta sandwich domain/Carbohydrate binding module (family 35)